MHQSLPHGLPGFCHSVVCQRLSEGQTLKYIRGSGAAAFSVVEKTLALLASISEK